MAILAFVLGGCAGAPPSANETGSTTATASAGSPVAGTAAASSPVSAQPPPTTAAAVAPPAARTATPTAASAPTAGGQIYYLTDESRVSGALDKFALRAVNADGSGRRVVLSDLPGAAGIFGAGPDGAILLYGGWPDGAVLKSVRPDGTGLTTFLGRTEVRDLLPGVVGAVAVMPRSYGAWSQDKSLMGLQTNGATFNVFRVTDARKAVPVPVLTVGTNDNLVLAPTTLYLTGAGVRLAVFSPDGAMLLASAARRRPDRSFEPYGLLLFRSADGQFVQNLTADHPCAPAGNSNPQLHSLDWSRASNQITYVAPPNCAGPASAGPAALRDSLWVMNADGSNKRNLISTLPKDSNGNTLLPRATGWSPTGTKIALIDTALGLYVVNADGSGGAKVDVGTREISPGVVIDQLIQPAGVLWLP